MENLRKLSTPMENKLFLSLKQIFPRLKEISTEKNERIKGNLVDKKIIPKERKVKRILLPLQKMTYEEEPRLGSARAIPLPENQAILKDKPSFGRRRSFSIGEKARKEKVLPSSAKNYRENNKKQEDNLTLSEVSELEEEEKYRKMDFFEEKTNDQLNEKIMLIQSKLLEEKNQEINLLKNKLKSFQELLSYHFFLL